MSENPWDILACRERRQKCPVLKAFENKYYHIISRKNDHCENYLSSSLSKTVSIGRRQEKVWVYKRNLGHDFGALEIRFNESISGSTFRFFLIFRALCLRVSILIVTLF